MARPKRSNLPKPATSRRANAGKNQFKAPPAPISVRARMVLRDAQFHRLVDKGLAAQLPRSGLFDPRVPEDILLGFQSIDIDGPHCEFLRQQRPTLNDLAAFSEKIKAASPSEAERIGREWWAAQWFLLDEQAVTWDRIVFARGIETPTWGLIGGPPRYGTQCGPVEQWLGLADVFTSTLSILRNPHMPASGVLRAPREMNDDDLVIGVTDGPPVLAAGTRHDFSTSTENPSAQQNGRMLSDAGLVLLVWAAAHQRLQAMYERLYVRERLQLAAISAYLERRKPVLEWEARDFELLQGVRANLIAAAPRLRGTPMPSTPAPSPPPLSTPTQRVILGGPGDNPVVLGRKKGVLTGPAYAIVNALLVAGEQGLTKDELDRQSNTTDARKVLGRLARSDADWGEVIRLPGASGRGYRLR